MTVALQNRWQQLITVICGGSVCRASLTASWEQNRNPGWLRKQRTATGPWFHLFVFNNLLVLFSCWGLDRPLLVENVIAPLHQRPLLLICLHSVYFLTRLILVSRCVVILLGDSRWFWINKWKKSSLKRVSDEFRVDFCWDQNVSNGQMVHSQLSGRGWWYWSGNRDQGRWVGEVRKKLSPLMGLF